MALISVEDLKLKDMRNGQEIVKGISFEVQEGRCLAIVGESGSGKSMTCRTFMGLHKPWIRQEGLVLFKGKDIRSFSKKEFRKLCGKEMAMIMQDGMSAFDPSDRIQSHFRETLREHFGYDVEKSDQMMITCMEKVMLSEPDKVLQKYPHQLSGGMLQRCMIALALALQPELIIADEPTTALDTITQYEVLRQFWALKNELGNAMIFISHDLGIVRSIADDLLVMREGTIVERGRAEDVFSHPQHEYTRYLINAKKGMNEKFNRIMAGRRNPDA